MPSRARGDAGAIAASVALMPIVITLFFTVIQVSLWFHGRSVAMAAAHQALEASRAYNGTSADGEAAANDFLGEVGGVDVQDIQVEIAGDVVTVTVQADPVTIVPGLERPVTITLQAPQERIVE
jgi:Flp pilus assembly protein TadG